MVGIKPNPVCLWFRADGTIKCHFINMRVIYWDDFKTMCNVQPSLEHQWSAYYSDSCWVVSAWVLPLLRWEKFEVMSTNTDTLIPINGLKNCNAWNSCTLHPFFTHKICNHWHLIIIQYLTAISHQCWKTVCEFCRKFVLFIIMGILLFEDWYYCTRNLCKNLN